MDGENVFDAKIIVRVLKEKEKERDKENRVSKPQGACLGVFVCYCWKFLNLLGNVR